MTTTPGSPEYLGGPSDGPGNGSGIGPGPGASAHAGDHHPGNDNRKRLIAVGAIVAGGAVVAGGAWAATSFFATGSQPAEALPDSTIGYVSVDLDPSGGQKIEAIRMLKKFPAFTDEINLDAEDDIRERLFEELTKSGECEGLDYAADVEPWLGSRAAMAAVDLGEDEPAPVAVVQVSDAGQAEDGMAALVDACGGGSEDGAGGWVVDGDWMVIGETEEIAQQVVDAKDGGTLASDSAFDRWTGEAGDDGFMTMYVAKAAAQYLDDAAGMGSMLGGMPMDGSQMGDEQVPEELQELIDKFDGAAATVRFDDGAVEVEYAMSNWQEDMTEFMETEAGVDMIGDLPDDTLAAFGFGLKEGWANALLDYVKTSLPEEADTIDEQLAQFEDETGLAFPEDVETLLGEGVTISLGSGIDPDAITNGGPGEIPAGIRIKGDAGEIQAVLDKISDLAGPEAAEFLQVTEGDDYAVIAMQDDYRGKLEASGDLGGSSDYSEVVEADNAQSVMYVNFDADDDWLVRVMGDVGVDDKDVDNLAPLSAFGVSGWVDGDVVHGMLKLTTD
ncbi:DUF3352 domain-containing protein [Nocardioides glacieisoli]|uniref:DUF3352 domain-containing protein n=1 Tax=Nocardioides glacieisoli TaxID=1168730 RepID=A0A4Q2S4D8_9ACTN|nr:DUF3352 domain-containing protein [Nocardioides glacieisoli]RYB96448.1 DUF3352 domain-containing protein [Nocardioides glacieisoli]